MKSNADVEKNLKNESNSKNFRKGTEPDTYGEGAETKGYGGGPVDHGNIVGATPDANEDRNRIMDKKVKTPREPVLNAVPMPNRTKMNKKDYSVLDVIGDEGGESRMAMGNVSVGATPKPNNIR